MNQQLMLDALGNRDTVRANADRGGEYYKIPLEKIFVIEGFNGRKSFEDIEELSVSILQQGQEQPGAVKVLKDGSFALIRGERRYRALRLLASQGHSGLTFKAYVLDRNITDEEIIYQELTTQQNSRLKSNEVADLIQRLLTLGRSQKEISEKLGKSQGWVSNMISFAREAQEVKTLVSEGKATMNSVLQTKRVVKNQAKRTESLVNAAKEGKKIKPSEIKPNSTKHEDCAKELTELLGVHSFGAILSVIKKHFK